MSRVGCNEYTDHIAYFEANPPFDLLIDQENWEEDFIEDESVAQGNVGDTSVGEEVIACEPSESVFVVAQTENYWVNICGGDAPYTYIGIDKTSGESLRLDLTYYEDDGSYFEAINGDYVYTVIFGTAKGSFLSVTQGNDQILQEPLLSW